MVVSGFTEKSGPHCRLETPFSQPVFHFHVRQREKRATTSDGDGALAGSQNPLHHIQSGPRLTPRHLRALRASWPKLTIFGWIHYLSGVPTSKVYAWCVDFLTTDFHGLLGLKGLCRCWFLNPCNPSNPWFIFLSLISIGLRIRRAVASAMLILKSVRSLRKFFTANGRE